MIEDKNFAEMFVRGQARQVVREVPVDDDGFCQVQAARVLAVLLNADFERQHFYDVVELIEQVDDYRDGNLDLELAYGIANTEQNRQDTINGLEEDLRLAMKSLVDSMERGY